MDWVDLLITPLAGAAVGFGVWYFQSRIDALRRAQERLHDERRKAYAGVLEPFIRVFAGLKNPKESQKAMAHMSSFEYRRTAFEFNLIGSDNVVKAFNNLMQYIFRFGQQDSAESDPKALMRLWGLFLLEIRRDVGEPNTKLGHTDMLRAMITDIDATGKEAI
ncbi:MAG TPA: hypothetical protein VNA25_27170 [Phycisphaerae bacterium]|nr:hypothetical protein [Phycisphaerae bacterium]